MIRLIPLVGILWGLYYLLQRQDISLHWPFIFPLLIAFILAIGFTWLRSLFALSISAGEFFGHLLIDISIYSLLMFNTGGASNPFISYLLVPITISAITLPPLFNWLTGACCLASYSLLLFWYIPLPALAPGHDLSHHQSAGPNLHLIGMWINFMVSAALIAYFVNRMAQTIRSQETSLNRQKQRQLEDEQLLAVATTAASAAHELGTPINTMRLITDEWLMNDGESRDQSLKSDLEVLRSQVDRCQSTLQKLAGTARRHSSHGSDPVSARSYFHDLVENWLVMRPDVTAHTTINGTPESATIALHPSIDASLHNLLNNAADANPNNIEITVTWCREKARVSIRDFGVASPPQQLPREPLESGKPNGMGLGLFLARSILERHGASVDLSVHPEGGAETIISLPMESPHE